MRIEITVSGEQSITTLQNSISSLHTDIDSTIAELQNVKNKMECITGGVGTLSGAVNSLKKRIGTDESKLNDIEVFSQKTSAFISNTILTDAQVAAVVNVNQEKFFDTHVWLRPSVGEEKSWWDRFVDGWNGFWGDAGKVIDSAVGGIVDFVKEHAVELAVGTAAVVAGAAIVALTGGTAAAFMPTLWAGLNVAAASSLTSGIISSATALVTGENVLEAFGDGLAGGFMWGGIFAGASSFVAGTLRLGARFGKAGKAFGKAKFWSPNSLGNNNAGGTLFRFGKKFHIDFDVNILDSAKTQFLHTHMAKSTYKAMPEIMKKMTWIFDPAKGTVHVRLIPIIAPITSKLSEKK